MPSPMVELKVAHLFKAIIEGEKQLEVYRQVLVEQPDFDPYLAFNFLDKASNGYLSSYSITEFLKEHNIELLEADLVKMFGKESSKIEQQLTFADFLKIILPRASPSLRQLSLTNTTTVKTPKKKDTTISYEIKWALARVIDKQVNFLKKIDSCREVVAKFGDFTLPNVFRSIDVEDIGVIDIDSIYIFLKKNKVFVSENDVMILLRSIDFAEDGKLSYEEFIQIVQPNNNNSTLLQQPRQRSAKKTTPSRSRSPKKSPAPSSKATPSKAKSKSPNRTVILAPQRKNSAASYKENKERMSMSMQRPRNRSSEKNSRANSTVNYGTMSTWKDRSFNEYSTIINVPNTMNTSMGSIGNSTGKTWGKRAASPMRTKSTATSELKNLQDKIYRKDSVQKKPEKVVETVLLEENNMNKEEERELASVLREQITLDREIEVMKQELSLQADFNVADIFRLFDVESRGLINKYQLLDGFDLFHVSANKKELYLLMKRFDRDRDGLLRYADFYDLLTPRQEDKDASYSGQRRLPRVLSMKTTFLLRKMLQTALSNEGCSECLRQRLHSRPGFSAYKAFKVLDRNMNGYITIEDFRELLDNYGLFASQKELAGLMGRFDKNHDDRVSYNDFVEEIRPRVQERHRK